jgi:hypothetical protein
MKLRSLDSTRRLAPGAMRAGKDRSFPLYRAAAAQRRRHGNRASPAFVNLYRRAAVSLAAVNPSARCVQIAASDHAEQPQSP